MTMVGGDRGNGKEHRPHPKKHDTFKSDGKKSGCHGNTEKSTEVAKRDGCYICGMPHCYARFPKLKSLGAILLELKEKNAPKQDITLLGLIRLCGAITKQQGSQKSTVHSMSTSRSIEFLFVLWLTWV